MRTPILKILLWIGAVLAVAGIAMGLAVLAGAPLSIGRSIGVFLAGFGLVKLAVGLDGFISRALLVTPGYTARESIGNPTMFVLWVAFRMLVGVVSLTIALWLLADPAAAERLMPR
jgi:hypothetical protein